jgi:two-component system, cell cycle response regulator
MRVLIAEDSRIERRILQLAVERLGHSCRLAEDGAQAWELFRAHGADVVISDRMMPGVDGLELCRRIRADSEAIYTYFIFLTALNERTHALEGMEAGADDYLTKPLDRTELHLRLIAASRVTRLHAERTAAQLREAHLEGVRLAARTMQHELGNALALAAGHLHHLTEQVSLTPGGEKSAAATLDAIKRSGRIVHQLQEITSIEEADWGPNIPATIDVTRSQY